ncbi:MAG: tRNA (adenosine(37)-N6)-threonylcarbamoyltransferase complex dimerization subunit type 1 TsaB [Bacilli bacterium]|nr:tRNA (adenosine(37)-N6)-threonylcarbamoyltransferase complex dimerization subunit type 1 TsaB [Bacilli bacterium]
MRILYIDTSSSYLYSAIIENQKCIASVQEEYGQSLSEIALPKIVEMFDKNNLSPKDVDKIMVVNGPGSFTGIRIGITIAKVYAWSLQLPITTITSLEAMAISSKEEKIHVPMLNARRGYVYAAIYNKDMKVIHKPEHVKWEDLAKELESLKDYEIISNDEFDWEVEQTPYVPDFVSIITKYKDKEPINPHAVNPDYLKLTEAEEKL